MPHSGILDGIGVFSWLTGWWKKWIYKLDPNRWLHMFGTRLVCLSPLAVNIFELFIFSAMHQTQYRHQPPSFSIHIIYNILYFQPSSYIYIVFLACGTGLWPAGRLMVNAEKIRDKSRDRFRPMTRDLVMAIQIEAYLALPSQKKTRTWCSSGEYTLHWRWKVTGY